MTLPPLYVIIDRETLDRRGLRVGAFARELCAAGVRLVQYRDKVSGAQEVLRAAAEISEAFAGVEATLVMNDRADLAALAAWGVHVGQGDLPVAAARAVLLPQGLKPESSEDGWSAKAEALALLEAGRLVGVSTHTVEQVREADASGADYVAVGPVFGTVTKLDAEAVVGLEGVRMARALTRKPLVVIGGITLGNCRSVVEDGGDSVAVISGVFVEGRTVGEVVREFLEILR